MKKRNKIIILVLALMLVGTIVLVSAGISPITPSLNLDGQDQFTISNYNSIQGENMTVANTIYANAMEIFNTNNQISQLKLFSTRGDDSSGAGNRSEILFFTGNFTDDFESEEALQNRGLALSIHKDGSTQPHHVTFYSPVLNNTANAPRAIEWLWGDDSDGKVRFKDSPRIILGDYNGNGWYGFYENETQEYPALLTDGRILGIGVDTDNTSPAGEIQFYDNGAAETDTKVTMSFAAPYSLTGISNFNTGADLYTLESGRVITSGQTGIEMYVNNASTLVYQVKGDYWNIFPTGVRTTILASDTTTAEKITFHGAQGGVEMIGNIPVINSTRDANSGQTAMQFNTKNGGTSVELKGDGELHANNGLTVTGTAYADEFSGNLSWSNLNNYPVACPAGSYLTQLDDSVTCTTVSAITNNLNVSGNFTNDLIPQTNNLYSIGSTLLRWAKGWFIDLDVSGTASIENLTISGSGDFIISMNSTSKTCNEANAGAIYYNNDTNKHYGCNVTAWQPLY